MAKKNQVFVLTIKHDPEVDSDVVLFTRILTDKEQTKIRDNIFKYKAKNKHWDDPIDLLEKCVYKPFKDIVIHVDGYNYVNAEPRF